MDEVKSFYINYIDSILNAQKEIIIFKSLANLDGLTGNAKMDALKKSIEKHPGNLVFYLNSNDIDATTKSTLVNYYIYEEHKNLVDSICLNPDNWLKLDMYSRSLLDEKDIVKISKAITQNLVSSHNKDEIKNGVAKRFLEYYAQSPYLSFLVANDDFCTLASTWYAYAKDYKYSFIDDSPYFDIIKNCMSTTELEKLEHRILNYDITTSDLTKINFNFKRLSPSFFQNIAQSYFGIIKNFTEIVPDENFSQEEILKKMMTNLSDEDLYAICLKAIKIRKETVLLGKTCSSFFSKEQRKKIYDILYTENRTKLMKSLINASGNYYFEYLTLKDLDTVYQILTRTHMLSTIKDLSLWTKLDEEQFNYLCDKLEKSLYREFDIEELKEFFSEINDRLAKRLTDTITVDLIKKCKKSKDISFFFQKYYSYFQEDKIKQIYTELKPLFMADIHSFTRLWPSLKACFSDNEVSKIIDDLIKEESYNEAYRLIFKEKRCQNKYCDIIDGLLFNAEKNKTAVYFPGTLTDEFQDYEMVKLFNIYLDIDPKLIFRYDFPKNPKHKRYIKKDFLKHYKKYSLKKQLIYLEYLGVSLKSNMEVINYIIDSVYESNIKKLNIFLRQADYIWEAVIKRASFHQEKLVKYVLTAKDEELADIKDIIAGNKFLSDINSLRENKLFKLDGYKLKGISDCFKLCTLYKKANTSVELFCQKYGIEPVSGFDEALRIIGTIDTQELVEISEAKAAASKKFYINMATLAAKLIDGSLSFEEYFTTDIRKFKNQKINNVTSVYKTRENANKFALGFIDYIISILDRKGYLPFTVLEFVKYNNDSISDTLQKKIKSNLILPKDKDYYLKYNRMLKFLMANTKSYYANGLLMEFVINGQKYTVDEKVIDEAYVYLRKNHYCISQDSMLMATRQIAMDLIDVSKITKEYKEELVSTITDTVLECKSLEEYIKMVEERGPKLTKKDLHDANIN